MANPYPFTFDRPILQDRLDEIRAEFSAATPFNHVVIDNFLPPAHAAYLSEQFPKPEHPIWLDWKKRSPHQFGKLGPGNSDNFHLLQPDFKFALYEFNSYLFLRFLEQATGIAKLLPDPYFSGGGMHQILEGGILDVHTDFNAYSKLDIYRQLNVLIYLNAQWQPSYGGELELWNGSPKEGGQCVKSVAPLFNRAVIFKTDKTSFHGHPQEWAAPPPLTRRSIALYYYTARTLEGFEYTQQTDFQGVISKELPKA